MHEEMKMEIEELHKEIDLVQGCINRMAQNSFHIKGWTVTIFAVVLALLPEKIAPTHAILLGGVMLATSIMNPHCISATVFLNCGNINSMRLNVLVGAKGVCILMWSS